MEIYCWIWNFWIFFWSWNWEEIKGKAALRSNIWLIESLPPFSRWQKTILIFSCISQPCKGNLRNTKLDHDLKKKNNKNAWNCGWLLMGSFISSNIWSMHMILSMILKMILIYDLPEMVHSCNSIAQFQRTEVKRGLTTKYINPALYMCLIKCISIYLSLSPLKIRI